MSTSRKKSGARSHDLDPRQSKAISALLLQPTIEKAAQSVGISEKTLSRWLEQPAFRAAYETARQEAFAQSVSLLHKATGAAVAALVKNLKCGNPSVEVRAAIGVLEQTYKGRELLEMERRLSDVERIMEHQQEWQQYQRRR